MRRLARALWFSTLVPSVALATDPPPPGPAPAAETDDDDDAAAKQPARAPAGATAAPIYQGVTLGADRLPPRAKPNKASKGPARLTWIGFQQRDGVPTVFVQLDKPVAWSLDQRDGRLVYTLVGATVPIPNNRRKLDAKEFGTTVQSVEARAKGRDVEVTISVKGKVTHTEKNKDGPGGFKFLVIGLPQG